MRGSCEARHIRSIWRPIELELLNRRKDSSRFWVEPSIVPLADERGWFTYWVSVQRDVSERRRSEEVANQVHIAHAQKIVLEAQLAERERVASFRMPLFMTS